jgi:molecular chaperone GrpE
MISFIGVLKKIWNPFKMKSVHKTSSIGGDMKNKKEEKLDNDEFIDKEKSPETLWSEFDSNSEENETDEQPSETVPNVVDQKRDPLVIAQYQAKEYLDSLQRLKADFDNYRKRTEKERSRLCEFYQSEVISTLIPTLESFESAFEKDKDHPKDEFRIGMNLLYSGLWDSLTKIGLERIKVVNELFDPEIAEALMVETSEIVLPNTVLRELNCGYKFKGKVIRPARVVVSTSLENVSDENVIEED